MNKKNTDSIQDRKIDEEMRESYLDYAMSVIVSRALPDVRDGLKPVQRRILFGMLELGVTSNASFKKSARIVGDVMGKLHPHGDGPIYEAMVRMTQDFTLRYPLVTGQGNFGSIDGDPPAAMRYTEAKLAPITAEILNDIEKDTVDYVNNFDDSIKEPGILPTKIPTLLINGTSGIAVGMATSIPPHNLQEICTAIIHIVNQPKCSIDDILSIVKGPDFPTKGVIFDQSEIHRGYTTGRGRVVMQAMISIEEMKNSREQLVITELPYQVNKAHLIQRIAELVRSKKISGISDIRDESDREGLRVVIELSRNALPEAVKAQLFKYTPLQSSFSMNTLALVNGQPRTLSLKEILELFIEHRRVIIKRRVTFDLNRASDRAHILEGLLIAIKKLDAVIKLIRKSQSSDDAKNNLMKTPYKLSDKQAQAVLDMQLRRLAQLETEKINDEYNDLLKLINKLKGILKDPKKVNAIIIDETQEVIDKFGDERKTKVVTKPIEDISDIDLIPPDDIVITISSTGYIKRVPVSTYRTQARGGRGVAGMNTLEQDSVNDIIVCNTRDTLLFFTEQGRVYTITAFETPEASRQATGRAIKNIIELPDEDQVTTILPVSEFDNQSLVLVTKFGEIKRTSLQFFQSVRRSGIFAMDLEKNDKLISAKIAGEKDNIMLIASDGQAIKFQIAKLRKASRSSGGVRGMKLKNNSIVIGAALEKDGTDLLVISENGIGKRTLVNEFPTQGRGGGGVRAFKVSNKSGKLVGAHIIDSNNQVLFISNNGTVNRIDATNISLQGRSTQGVKLQDLLNNDYIASMATYRLKELTEKEPVSTKKKK
ncbi:MAG: DNA gyrase subunit A [Chloroflexi bacterium]|nr:DNA gyrase subunit A [Chloroflexota bacterium]|tara:strand:+ start:688 stop:3159 length:2472 start_codon:yes stop_codon:yes gene_type:complete